jgi:hypothetical protein
MANKWVEHIKKWAKANNSTYGCALSNPKCKEDYKKSKEEPKQEEKIQKIQKAIINILEPNKANKPETKKIDKKKLYEEDIKDIKSELNHKEDRAKRDYKINWRTMQYYADIGDYMKIINDENISNTDKKQFIRNQYEIKDNYLRDQLLKSLI